MPKIKAYISYGNTQGLPSISIMGYGGTCYSEAEITLPDYLEIKERYDTVPMVGYNDIFVPADNVIFYNKKNDKVYINNIWNIPNKPKSIVLKAKIEEDTHFSN